MNRNGQLQSPAQTTLTELLRAMCRYPGELKVIVPDGRKPIISLIPHQADYGVLCGAKGKHIQAIRCVAKEMFAKDDRQPHVELESDGPGLREPVRPFRHVETWDAEPFKALAWKVCWQTFGGLCGRLDAACAGRDPVKATLRYNGPHPGTELEEAVGLLLGCTLTGKRLVFEVEAKS